MPGIPSSHLPGQAPESRYWTRRDALRAGVMGLGGLAAAALLACTGRTGPPATPAGPTASPTLDPALEPAVKPGRNRPGLYDGPIPPSPAELDPAANARYGGTLRMRYLEPAHLDINRTLSCTTFHPLSYTNSRLVRARSGASVDPWVLELEPDLAESWVVNADATEFTFNLRKGVRTHDVAPLFGREFTSEDVRLSWERYRAGGTQRDIYAPLIDIITPDDYTIVARLDQPLVDFAANLASWSYLWPRELIDDEALLTQRAMGTGPFVLEEWKPGEGMVLARHPDYFEPALPYLDRIVLTAESDRAEAQALFAAHELHGVEALDDVEMAALRRGSPDSALVFKFPRSRGSNVNGWHFQLQNPVFQDVRVRRAISLAFDRAAYDDNFNAGDNESPDGPFSNAPLPWPYLFDEYPTAAANGPWYQHDPARASALMRAADYTPESPLEFDLVSYYATQSFPQQVIPSINENLPEVRIGYREVEQQTYVEMLSNRSFEAAIGIVWGPPGYSVDQWIYPWWHSRGGLNYNGVDDAELDRLLELQRAAMDPLERRQLWRSVWDRVHDQVYDVWWPEAHLRGAQHNYVMNLRWHGLTGSYTCYGSDQARAIWLDDGAPGLER